MKKPALALLVGDKDEEEAPKSSKSEGDDEFAAAAEELFEAIKADDKDGFVEALRAAMSC